MQKNKKLTLSIGIPAHNEEHTLPLVLKLLRSQQGTSYILEEILVMCDGCTDETAAIARKLAKNWKAITVLDDGKQLGKALRVQQAQKRLQSEVILLLDADVKIIGIKFLEHLTKAFINPKVGLAGAAVRVINPKGVVQKSLARYEEFWDHVKVQINEGNNVHNNMGCAFAIRNTCAKQIKYPKHIVADDHFTYFWVKKHGWQFAYVKDAIVGYKVPASVKDYLVQTARYLHSQKDITAHYGAKDTSDYFIPFSIKVRAYWQTFLSQPFELLVAVSLQILSRITTHTVYSHLKNPSWGSVTSTK